MKPQLADPITDVPEGDEWVIEAKLDGWRAVATITASEGDESVVELTTRSGNLIDTVPYINRALGDLFPPDTILDGELVAPAVGVGIDGWGEAQGDLTRTSNVQQDGSMVYVIFDLMALDGEDCQSVLLAERRLTLERLFSSTRRKRCKNVALIEQERSSVEAHRRHLAAGYEGSVVKSVRSRYRQNTRGHGWFKVKPQKEAEAEAIGFYAPTPGSKYDGVAVGGILFRLPGGYEGRAAGMTDDERIAMYEAWTGTGPDRWTGNVIELRHHGETADGALRHPQYVRVRDPKDKAKPSRQRVKSTARPEPAHRPAPRPGTASKRNYSAMKDDKLLRAIRELQLGGEAFDKCTAGGYDAQADLNKAWAIAQERGLEPVVEAS